MSTQRINIQYGKYRIIAGETPQGCKANAFIKKRLITDVSAPSIDGAIQNLKSLLDERDRTLREKRIDGIPTAEEYRMAFEAIDISTSQLAMLKAHYHAKGSDSVANIDDKTMGTEELAEAAGYADYSAVNLQYGALGRRLAEFLEYQPPIAKERNEPVWTFAIATGKPFAGAGLWIWTMRPEVAEALRQLNLV